MTEELLEELATFCVLALLVGALLLGAAGAQASWEEREMQDF